MEDIGIVERAIIARGMDDREIVKTITDVIGHARAGRLAAHYNFYVDQNDVTITLVTDGENGKAVCTCGWDSGDWPWADFLEEMVKAHSSGHLSAGQRVNDRTDD